MCGDCNAEQFRDLKTPQGKVFTDSDNLMYGRMWMVTMDNCKGMYTKQHLTVSVYWVRLVLNLYVDSCERIGKKIYNFKNARKYGEIQTRAAFSLR